MFRIKNVFFTRKETSDIRDDAELGGAEELDDVAYFRASSRGKAQNIAPFASSRKLIE